MNREPTLAERIEAIERMIDRDNPDRGYVLRDIMRRNDSRRQREIDAWDERVSRLPVLRGGRR